MEDSKKPYLILMNACEDAIRALEKEDARHALFILIQGQQRAEEVFLAQGDT